MRVYGKRNRTRVITIHILERELRMLDRLVSEGYFISRSEAIRHAIHRLIHELKSFEVR